MELLGVNVPKRCGRCMNCSSCFITEEGRSLQEQMELDLMRQNVLVDRSRKKVVVEYPIVGDISQFKDNREQAHQRSAALWKSLERRGLLSTYEGQVLDYIKRGVWKETTLEEIEEYKASGGPIHFVAHHGVQNPGSKSTPLRIVVDSATKNNWTGPTINQIYAKGPNTTFTMS